MNTVAQKIRILHVEDLPSDAELVTRELKRGGLDFEIKVVDNQQAFNDALDQHTPDIILSDHSLPSFSSLSALKIIHSRNLDVPFILITSNTSEETAVSVMKAGAWDYILKDRMQRLPLAVKQAIEKHHAEIEKKKAEEALWETHEKLFFHIENSPLGFIDWRSDFSVKSASTRAKEIFGWSNEDIEENKIRGLDMIFEEDREWVMKEANNALQNKSLLFSNHLIHRSYRKDGTHLWCEWFNSISKNQNGDIISMMSLISDITERKNLEQELLHDQFFLEKASESAKIGYWSSEPLDENGKLIWSKEVFKIFGMAEKDFKGTNKDFFERVHPEDRQRVSELSRQALEKSSIYDVDHRIILPNGSVRWVNEKAQVLRDEKNNPTLMIGVVQDINDRKIIEEVLREYNDRYEILSKATKDVIWDWDVVNDRVLYNQSLQEMLGYHPMDVRVESLWWEERVHRDDHDLVIQDMNEVFAKHLNTWEFSYRFRTAANNYKYINDRSFVIYDKKGSPIRMIGAMQDVTEITEYRLSLEQKVIERTKELNQALQKEKELVDLRSRFVSIASHEFRTPLSSIALATGFIKKFKKKLKPEDLDKKLQSIDMQVNHMTALLGDVLTVGKGDAGKIEVNWVDVNLQSLLSELAVEVTHSTKNTHAIKLNMHCSIKSFKTDEGLIRNIVINLLTNAIKFSPSAKTVDLTVECSTTHLTLRVRDYGVGVPPEELEKIFEAFYRVKSSSSIGGTGLGLSIVKKATELLEGNIQVKSNAGQGSEFIVTLPFK